MTPRRPQRKRAERQQHLLESHARAMDIEGPSEGMYAVLDMETKEKYKGLNYKQAVQLWETLSRSVILNDQHV